MRHKLLQIILSQDGLPIIGCLTVGGAILVERFRERPWSVALCIVLFIPAIYGTLIAAFILLAGSYAMPALPGAALSVGGFVALIAVRPRRSAFTARTWAYTAALLIIGFIVVMLPRPGAFHVPVAVFDPASRPVPDASISYTVFGGAGANYDGTARTDSDGRFTFIIYRSEWGHLRVDSPSGTVEYNYDHAPEIVPGGRHNGIRFSNEDFSQSTKDKRSYIHRIIAANSNEVLDAHLNRK